MSNSVVFQLRSDEPSAILQATQNARNLLQQLPGTPVEIVVQGGAVAGLVGGTQWAEKLLDYLDNMETVHVLACENALKAHEVSPETLLEPIGTVPAGVAHVAQRQWAGWAYLRV